MRRAASSPRAGFSLERKLPLWISLLLVAVVGAMTWASYVEVSAGARTAVEERLKRFTAQLAEISAVSNEQRSAVMRALAADPRLVPLLSATTDTLVDPQLFQRLVSPVDSSLVVELRDASGRRRAGTVPLAREDALRSDSLAREVLGSDSLRNTRLYARGDSVFFWSGVPIKSGRRTVGALLQRRWVHNSERADLQIRNLLGGRDARVFVANSDHDLWVTLVGKPVPVPAIAEAPDSLFGYGAQEGAMLASASPVRGTPWTVVTQVPEASVAERPRAFIRRMALVSLLVVALGALVAWLLSRHVTRPLVALRGASEVVAAGGDPPTLAVASRDELGLLAESFNTMAERVRASRRELERQVMEARQLTSELERAQSETLRAATQSARLQSVTAALSSAGTPEEVATVIVEQGISAVSAQAGSIAVLSEDGAALELVRAQGYSPALLTEWMRIPITMEVPLARVVRTGEPDFIDHAAAWAERYPPRSPLRLRPESRSWVALPLVVEGKAIGAMGLSFGTEGPFSPDEQAFLRTLAQLCAQALERSRLYQAERRARREAEESRARADEARRAAEAANQSKSDFLAVMSHELRTPLNAIGGYTQLLQMGLRGQVTEEQKADLERIRKSQHHLLNLINDVLHFAKLDAGRVVYDVQEVPIHELFDELEALVAPQIAAKGLRYEHGRCEQSLVALGDREKMRQVVLNLVSNAVKFTPTGGLIEVSCEPREQRVAIHVRDTGVGIPAERLETIFDPFFQVDRRLTRAHEGIGLGLAISRDLARGMDGELSVRSTVGAGSTFTLLLPGARRTTPTSSVASDRVGTA